MKKLQMMLAISLLTGIQLMSMDSANEENCKTISESASKIIKAHRLNYGATSLTLHEPIDYRIIQGCLSNIESKHPFFFRKHSLRLDLMPPYKGANSGIRAAILSIIDKYNS